MKPISRRCVTTGLAAAVTAIPAVGLCRGATEGGELRSLIETHRAAVAAFTEALSRNEEGPEVEATGEADIQAFWELCCYPCRNIREARVKAEYLLTTYLVRDSWDQDAKAVLESFIEAIA
jgi:hypothetical protein